MTINVIEIQPRVKTLPDSLRELCEWHETAFLGRLATYWLRYHYGSDWSTSVLLQRLKRIQNTSLFFTCGGILLVVAAVAIMYFARGTIGTIAVCIWWVGGAMICWAGTKNLQYKKHEYLVDLEAFLSSFEIHLLRERRGIPIKLDNCPEWFVDQILTDMAASIIGLPDGSIKSERREKLRYMFDAAKPFGLVGATWTPYFEKAKAELALAGTFEI